MISDDQFRIIMAMMAAVPLSYCLRFLKVELQRELYSIITGTLLQYYVYGKDVYLVFILHALIYIIVCFKIKKLGAVVTYLSMILLSIYHIYRMSVDYGGWTLDISVIIMTMVCKYSEFAYAIQDGRTPPEKLTDQQQQHSLGHVPSIIRYLGFCQFVPTSVVGTGIPFRVYENYITLKNQYVNMPPPWMAVGKDMGYAILLMLVFVIHLLVFPLKTMQDPSFSQQSFLYIMVFGFFSVTTIRFKYYFGWKFSQGAVHASGISYHKEKDGSQHYNLVQTCNPEIVETTMHVRIKIANWNMTTQQWLRRCVYERIPIKNKMISQSATFLVSSFWHGYYGGYYISFFLWFCHQYASQLVFKESIKQKSPWRNVYLKTGIVGKILLWISSNFMFSVSGIFFQVLSFGQSLSILNSLYHVPTICYFIIIFVFTKFATRERKNKGIAKEVDQKEKSKEVSTGQKKDQ